ncbi:PAS domain-containing protein [Polyangium aurulentum]|uniref:PAS domain-containing protein n=1 Tax=Polyangium aurulentum TaxID=2567896 RepID=UPI0010AE2593|nr:STAS domain-containing protein [Polyangium aurulentum]UQA54874.1 PAS domain-containing protein [Polyangium aurulentum]
MRKDDKNDTAANLGTLVLEQGEQGFRMYADVLPVMIWIAFPDGWIDFVNNQYAAWMGYSRERLQGEGWVISLHPEDADRCGARWRHSLDTGEPYYIEIRCRHASDEYRWIAVTANAIRDAEGKIMRWVGIVMDVHDRYVAQAALAASESRYRLYAEATREGIWFWDMRTNRVDWSPRMYEIAGLAPGAFGDTFEGFFARVHPDDREGMNRALADHLERGEPYRYEYRFRMESGEYRQFMSHGLVERDAQGGPVCMAGGVQDLTEQKKAEALLQERLQIIEQQAAAIRELSTPIIEVWEGVLSMPLLGTIDSDRAERMMSVLLDAVVARQCRYTIVDLTGVSAMDSATAEHVGRLLSAVALLGARGIVVGIKPEVARTMIALDIDLSRVKMLANLREALLFVMREDRAQRAKGG